MPRYKLCISIIIITGQLTEATASTKWFGPHSQEQKPLRSYHGSFVRTALVADISAYPVQSGAPDIQSNFNKPTFISRRTGIISPTWKRAAL